MILLNDVQLTFETFPNNETKVNENEIRRLFKFGLIELVLKYENDADLIRLMFVKKYMDSLLPRSAVLKISYMPYSRQDRVEGLSAFTLKYVSEFINSLGFDTVVIYEPHSDVTPALINRSFPVYPTMQMLNKVIDLVSFSAEKDCIFFPDAGAQKRYGTKIDQRFKQVAGYKKRDFQSRGNYGYEDYRGSPRTRI
jgi:ribose-phosphate pyrophosphokinase